METAHLAAEAVLRLHHEQCGCEVLFAGAVTEMSEQSVHVSAAELEDIVGDDALCKVVVAAHFSLGQWSQAFWEDEKLLECRRTAVATLLVVCPEHGTIREGICDRHLELARSGANVVTDGLCEEPATWYEL
jgi:hypothetical protein